MTLTLACTANAMRLKLLFTQQEPGSIYWFPLWRHQAGYTKSTISRSWLIIAWNRPNFQFHFLFIFSTDFYKFGINVNHFVLWIQRQAQNLPFHGLFKLSRFMITSKFQHDSSRARHNEIKMGDIWESLFCHGDIPYNREYHHDTPS